MCVISERPGVQEIEVSTDRGCEKAICYPGLTGPVQPGDEVVVNTTAVDLGLGSGGFHFVIWVRNCTSVAMSGIGHIMKLRYTPYQVCTGSYEEHYPDAVRDFAGLCGMPVVIAELHSMVAPVALAVAASSSVKVAYVMTDGAALPIAFSRSMTALKSSGLVSSTITAGHAFGGDLEAVNIHSALIAAKQVARADLAIVSMGPGIVGTGTKYGFTGLEQGYIIDAVNTLGGTPVFVPRLSATDERKRHRGLSHHSITVLENACCTSTVCVLASDIRESMFDQIWPELVRISRARSHVVVAYPCGGALERARILNIDLRTMGKGIEEEPEFFATCGAAGAYAVRQFAGR